MTELNKSDPLLYETRVVWMNQPWMKSTVPWTVLGSVTWTLLHSALRYQHPLMQKHGRLLLQINRLNTKTNEIMAWETFYPFIFLAVLSFPELRCGNDCHRVCEVMSVCNCEVQDTVEKYIKEISEILYSLSDFTIWELCNTLRFLYTFTNKSYRA